MITGFNPADMYGVDHIRRVLTTFPGVFTGIGEFSIHKEFVCAKIPGETASLTNPALDRILDFAAEAGLVVILHNDIDMPFAKPDAEPVYLTQMKALLKRHPKTTIIWAHIGLGRIVHPVQVSAEAAERTPTQLAIVEAMLTDPALAHVSFDISWDEVAKYAVASPESIARVAGDAQQVPGPVPVRHRHRGARRPGAVLRGLRHVGAGLAPADAGGEPQGAQGQLRADLRRRTAQGPGLGKGQRAMNALIEKGDVVMRSTRTNRSAGVVWLLTMVLVPRLAAARRRTPAGGTTARQPAQKPQVLVQAEPAEAEPRDLRLRDARHRPRLQADPPGLVRHPARHQAAVVRERVR